MEKKIRGGALIARALKDKGINKVLLLKVSWNVKLMWLIVLMNK